MIDSAVGGATVGDGGGGGQVTVTVTWPALPATIDKAAEIVDQLQADLRERADVARFDESSLAVTVYRRDEVEAVAADVLDKLEFIGLPLGTTADWVDDAGRHVRTLDAPTHPNVDTTA